MLVGATSQIWHSGINLKVDPGQQSGMKMSVGLSSFRLTSRCFLLGCIVLITRYFDAAWLMCLRIIKCFCSWHVCTALWWRHGHQPVPAWSLQQRHHFCYSGTLQRSVAKRVGESICTCIAWRLCTHVYAHVYVCPHVYVPAHVFVHIKGYVKCMYMQRRMHM